MGVRSRDKKKFNGGGTVYSGWDSNQTSPNYLHEKNSHKKKGKLKIINPVMKQHTMTEGNERGFKSKLNRKPAGIYKQMTSGQVSTNS